MKHFIWNNNDGNDSFEVEGDTFQDVLINALAELGWSVSEKPITEDEEDKEKIEFPEGETYIEAKSKDNPNLIYLVLGKLRENRDLLGAYKVLIYSDGSEGGGDCIIRLGLFGKEHYTFSLSDKTF